MVRLLWNFHSYILLDIIPSCRMIESVHYRLAISKWSFSNFNSILNNFSRVECNIFFQTIIYPMLIVASINELLVAI